MVKRIIWTMARAAYRRSPAPSADISGAVKGRGARLRAVADVRRSLVLDAARAAFIDLGLEGATLREIAKRAGYTPGAIYSYFKSKEEVYGILLGESLDRLNAAVAAAVCEPMAGGRRRAARQTVRTKAGAFFEFYLENPRDLDLGFYLFHGMKPRGLTEALNERLNTRLRDALQPTREALIALGLDEAVAQIEVTALFAHCAGLLLLNHTGRIRMFHQDSTFLFARYLEGLLDRTASLAKPAKHTAMRA
jgi:AcrR family transcriptional regulator